MGRSTTRYNKKKPNDVRAAMPDLQYVFIDEFQDITQTRLDAMFGLKKIYYGLTFFTIGDKDQSIYGFEKKNLWIRIIIMNSFIRFYVLRK